MIASTYAFLAGLLLGAGVGGHALRLTETPLPAARRDIAVAAVVLYGVAAIGAATQNPAGPLIAVVGPAIGVSAVLLTGYKIDRFQAVLGVFQALAAAIGAWLLAQTLGGMP